MLYELTSLLTEPEVALKQIPLRLAEEQKADFLLVCSQKKDYPITQKKSHIVAREFFKTDDCSAIEEARGYGISLKLLCDSWDQMVIHPGHLGCEKFRYLFEKESWGNCYSDEYSREEIEKYRSRLFQLGRIFAALGFRSYLLDINCSGKGYMNLYHGEITKASRFGDDDFDEFRLGRDDVLLVHQKGKD